MYSTLHTGTILINLILLTTFYKKSILNCHFLQLFIEQKKFTIKIKKKVRKKITNRNKYSNIEIWFNLKRALKHLLSKNPS